MVHHQAGPRQSVVLTEWSGVGSGLSHYLLRMEANTDNRDSLAARRRVYRDLRRRNERRARDLRILAAHRQDRTTQAMLARRALDG
jgi:hypothetical protein